jgi:outer membrane protein TolC
LIGFKVPVETYFYNSKAVSRLSQKYVSCIVISFAFVMAGGLGGCAVGPDFVSLAPPDLDRFTPEKLTAIDGGGRGHLNLVAGADIPQRWWQAFHDKNLNKLIEASIEHNPSLQAADAAIQMAFYSAEAQKGGFLPTALLNSDDSYNRQAGPAVAVSPNGPTNPYGLFLKQLTVSYTPDIWGQNRRAVESLEAQTDQQRYQLEAAYLTLTTNVAAAAITEASLRGQITATRQVIQFERRNPMFCSKKRHSLRSCNCCRRSKNNWFSNAIF